MKLLLALLIPVTVLAQQPAPTPELPSPPFLEPIPPGMLWTLEREAGAVESTTPAGTVLRRESVKSETVRRDVFLIAPSVESERWMAGGYLLIGAEDPQNIVIFSEEVSSRTDWLSKLDFIELDWVSPETLVGWEKPGESAIIVFEAVVPTRADGLASISLQTSAPISSQTSGVPTHRVRAWIDVENKRPVAYFDGQYTYRYSFHPGKVIPALPEDFRLRLESYLRRKRSFF